MKHLFRASVVTAALLLVATLTCRSEDFAAAAAKSAAQAKTSAGIHYSVAFMRSTGKVLVPATLACLAGRFPIGTTYDVVFIVAPSGRIERVLHGTKSAYGDCIASHLAGLKSAAKPPSAPWPVHVRFLHGHADRKAEQASIILADDAER